MFKEQSWIDGVVRITISHRFNDDYVNEQRMVNSLEELLLFKEPLITDMVRGIRTHENEILRKEQTENVTPTS